MFIQQPQVALVSRKILEGYKSYLSLFHSITKGAEQRFIDRDWHGMHSDSQERLSLYKIFYRKISGDVRTLLSQAAKNKNLWKRTKDRYREETRERPDREIARTFFNSVCRKVFNHQPVDEQIMFILSSSENRLSADFSEIARTYPGNLTPEQIVRAILNDYGEKWQFENIERDEQFIVAAINKVFLGKHRPDRNTKVEVLKPIFYRNKAAYIVGRTHISGGVFPFVLPFLNEEKGVFADTVLFKQNAISVIFSFTRTYFMADINLPELYVQFLQSLMPAKSLDELYNSIGFNKHGKTELWRSIVNHLNNSDDKFEIAPGIRGMVMSVFTLPNFPIVFKLIRDKFAPPKQMTKPQVIEKYKLVSVHDRVGRMADTHEFVNIEFDKNRFSEELLTELQTTAPSIVTVADNKVRIEHLYTERKMIPLNIFLENANDEEAEQAVEEYGNAIKQLAAANIFPGDMLLKNFGVTRHHRVVFYDYDEICFLMECNFRRIPEPRNEMDEMAAEPWYSVGPNDIFPEEFTKFLIGRQHIREMFFRLHGDIFEIEFWKEMQQKQIDGEIVNVFPYRRKMRFQG